MDILEIHNLYKNFGSLEVIKGLDLSVPEHSIFGFVGKNGAGKTTTMKMVLGLIKPTSGNITVCGDVVTYGETKSNRHIGYLPDVPEFYGYMKPMEYLSLCGEITGLSKGETKKRSVELLELVGLNDIKRRIGGFSRGMKQRLGIAQALLNEPQLIICDEPTSALDPIGRKEILDILSAVRGKTTVIFSTHILSDVERICDRVAVMNGGKTVLCGTLNEIKSQHRHNGYLIEFSNENDLKKFLSLELLKSKDVNSSYDHLTLTIKLPNIDNGGHLLMETLVQQKILPARFEALEPTLENLFLEVVV